MPFNFPPAPTYKGLTFLSTKRVFFNDQRVGRRVVFPVYHYREEETGELTLVAEDQYEEVLDKLIEMGSFGPKAGRA